MDDNRRILPAAIGPGPLTLGLTYTACSFVAVSPAAVFVTKGEKQKRDEGDLNTEKEMFLLLSPLFILVRGQS